MLRIILFLTVIIGLSFLGSWFADNNGNVNILWLGYRVDTSVTFIAAASAVMFLLSLSVIELILFIKNFPKRIRQNLVQNKYEKALLALTNGFVSIASNDTKSAEKSSNEALKLLKHHPISLIFATKVAELKEDKTLANKYLENLLEHKDTKNFAITGLLNLARQEGDYNKALKFAKKAYGENPNLKEIPTILLTLYKQTGKWEEAHLFLDKYKSKKRFSIGNSEVDFNREKSIILFMIGKKYFDEGKIEESFKLVEDSHKLNPSFVPATLLSCDIAIKMDKKRKAANIIETTWKNFPYTELATKYFDIYSNDNDKQRIKRAKKLSSINKDHSESHRALSYAYLKAGDTTLARNHLKMAMADHETTSLCNMMIDIEKSCEDPDDQVIQKWSNRIKHAHEDPEWHCSKCGYQSSNWDIECFSCGAVDQMVWGTTTAALRKIENSNNDEKTMLSA